MTKAIVAMTEEQFDRTRFEKGIELNAVRIVADEAEDVRSYVFTALEQRWVEVPFPELTDAIEHLWRMTGNSDKPLAVIDSTDHWPETWQPLTPFNVWQENIR